MVSELVKKTTSEVVSEPWSAERAVLQCPGCKEPLSYLHHVSVTVYDRSEDYPVTTVTHVRPNRFSQKHRPSDDINNPSARRDGMVIKFSCELCKAKPELIIAQHKGHTEVGWKYFEEVTSDTGG